MKTNEELRQDVMEEINWDPQLSQVATEIGVTAKGGMVTLSGLVATYSEKLAAERAAQRVDGVAVVAVDIEVKLKGVHKRSDIEIASAVKNALLWNTAVNEGLIKAKVDEGVVYLDGAVEWEYQKRAAEIAVRDLMGVLRVINRVEVKSKAIDPKEIKGKIAAALHRSATVDSSSIRIDVEKSRVVLRGRVRSWAERQDAENAVWSSPGVTVVANQIEVNPEVLV